MALKRKKTAGPQFAGPPGAGNAAAPVPARLRMVTESGPGPWLPGALRLSPGSLLWVPDKAGSSQPIELATATRGFITPGDPAFGNSADVTDLHTPAGQVQLELDPTLFEMSQELVTGSPG